MPVHSAGCVPERNPEFRKPESFIMGNKYVCTLLQREPLSLLCWLVSMPGFCFSVLLAIPTSLKKNNLEQRQSVPLLARCTEMQEIYRTLSQQKVSKNTGYFAVEAQSVNLSFVTV